MASHAQDGADGATPRSVPALLQPKKPRSSQDVRRNRLNMEKMIMKNVAGSRIGTKNRAQQIVEALKKKRQQQQQEGDASASASGAPADDAERAPKRKKAEPPSDAAARTAVAAGILSPTRRSNAATPGFTSPARRPSYPPHLRSPTPQLLSPARARGVNPLHLASPVRPPRSAAAASPARPRRSANMASPLRRSEFLTSPLRHRASASPKRPLTFDDTTVAATGEAPPTRINGHPPLLASALDQVELAPPAKSNKVVRSAKSPFQSFQAKFNKSPAKPARVTSSPGAARAGPALVIPRSGPTLMDLTHSEEAAPVVAPGTGYATPSTSMQCAVATNPADASSGSAASSTSSGTGPVAGGEGSSAAPASIVPAGVPPPTPTRTPKTPSQPPKPVRKLFSSRVVVAQKSICFSTEGVATALDVTPDGEIVVVGFTDGSVRLYEMDSSVPSDRHGYLLGHIDEQSSQGSFNVHLRVKISPDGRYVFVGCRHTQPRVIMSINLDHYRSEKDGDDDDFQQFQKHFHSSSRVRGFADVTTYVPPADQVQETKDKRSAYYILTGLGVGTLNLWRFIEPYQHQEPIWEHLQHFGAGGNTAMTAAFLPSSLSPGVLAIAAACKDKNMRVWPLEFQKASSSSASDSNNDSAAEGEDTDFLGGVHTVNTHFTIQNTPDIGNAAIHGQHAYGISLMGEAYRICLPDASTMNAKSCERLPRQEFELEKIDGNGSSKSRRSNIMLESLAASDDGKAVVAVSTDGIFYYSNDLPAVGSDDVVNLRIIGKNASENALYKAPMKVYTPVIISNGKKTKSEAMMAVVTNPGGEDSDEVNGYINVDPTEGFAARWMVPSRGSNCWVCGVRNVRHWIGPPESKTKSKEPTRAQLMAEEKERKKVLLRRERALKKAQDTTARQRSSSNGGDPDTPSSAKTRTPRVKPSAPKQKDVQSDASADSGSGTPRLPPPGKRRRISQTSGAGDDDDDEGTGSDDNTPSVASLMNELEHFKKRNAEIKTEWQRRLLGERQLRRKWKQREEEFLEQLNDSLTKLDATEVEVGKLRVLLRDAEKRFAFEKARAEQENSVKVRYDQLCEQMNEKMALVSDQKRLLEQTTRSLLAEVDRNVHALKNAVILEKTECVVCKDQQAVTAVVPCGHLCFCEQDAETYRRNCTSEYPTCPICQQEIVSLLRIYT
ncbi:RNA-binding E3 ubiquitin-protein ligase MEX3C [Phytophthora cinnamomi]|uniref:RNA-binding E3 ubiquitin-protein ligase MEX3C n=1 Tax=Phytophthora cinnamomi TaxID=4785 RepID=UPI003559A988|nr:RNA-binding E3 ubiquitin-protein ligase MEX3C [Phytophthora cinnamomi]